MASRSSERHPRVLVAIEEPLGPGLDIAIEPGGGLLRAVSGRPGSLWLGLDRGAVVETDSGSGSPLPVVVALPASSFVGCRMEVEVVGAWRDRASTVIVAQLPGAATPPDAVIRTVARVGPDATWIDGAGVAAILRDARARYKARLGQQRSVGGRAWAPPEGMDASLRRRYTGHSAAELRVDHLPPRFVRGLEGLLDDDERILYAVERPPAEARGLLDRTLHVRNRRAALLLLTDREILWLVDHVPPDRYLLDWGVDVRMVPVEAIRDVNLGHGPGETVSVSVGLRHGRTAFSLRSEQASEAEVMADLLGTFTGRSLLPLRRYEIKAVEFDASLADRFGQAGDARSSVERLAGEVHPEEVLAAFFAPRREGGGAGTLVLTPSRIILEHPPAAVRVELRDLSTAGLSLSPLVGKFELEYDGTRTDLSYPATFGRAATDVFRSIRRAWANTV